MQAELTLETITSRHKTNYSENELVLPALLILEEKKETKTSELIKKLNELLQPMGHDAHLIPGRQDTYFSQKVRNLKSHNTLQRQKLANYRNDGSWRLTHKGREFISANEDALYEMRRQGFNKKQISSNTRADHSNLVIEEGAWSWVTVEKRKRSQRLKREAIERFKKKNENIYCEACRFCFDNAYPSLRPEYIEIHHLRPIYLNKLSGIKQHIDQALTNTKLVCSNCHRMIHHKKKLLTWDVLVQAISFSVIYQSK